MIAKKTGIKRLVILDSHAILHRAYHAIPNFSTSTGEPTGALYGLATMLLKLVDDLKPDYVMAARDLPGKTHRHEIFEAYKGTRSHAEDELVIQLQRAPEVLEAFGVPVLSVEGFEADDVIGTLAAKAMDIEGLEVIIATGDMDTLQLVTDRVKVYTLRKGMNDTILYDSDRVRERYGFGPEHVVDYKALRGDPSDNIPGIKGIGDKGATLLIENIGDLDDIYAAVRDDEAAVRALVKNRTTDLLKEGEKEAYFSKQLATIHTTVPIDFALPPVWNLVSHAASAEQICDKYEFRALKERIRALVRKGDTSSQVVDASRATPEPLFPVAPVVPPDPVVLAETALALWVLKSDYTNPGIEEIYRHTGVEDFTLAREKIYTELAHTPSLQAVYDRIEKPLLSVVARMNAAGICLNTAYLAQLATEYRKELDTIAARIYAAAGHSFNINSPKQLAAVLYDELGISTGSGKHKKTATGARTTREDELLKLSEEHPIVGDVLQFRELSKLLGTYVEKLPGLVGEDGRLHATFLQTGTVTGRMGCEDPNLQNIPTKTEYGRRIRDAFVARQGSVLVAIDYSQIELRIAAGLSGDEKLCAAFMQGEDIHATVAAQVFGVAARDVTKEMRRRAKVINFGILYGMGVNSLREALGPGVTREEASDFLAAYFERFSGVARFVERIKNDATRLGYTETLFGRRRYFPALKSSLPQMRAQAERMAVNAPIQGTQSDIIKLAMVAVDEDLKKRELEDKVTLLLQVHDELVYEVDARIVEDVAPQIRAVMESVAPTDKLNQVPIRADISIGTTWGEMHKI